MSQQRILNILILVAMFCLLIASVVGTVYLLYYSVKVLTAFIIKGLEINEYYANNLFGFFFLLCSSLLVFILIMLDGEERRIQKALRNYVSKMIAKDYYKKTSVLLAGQNAGADISSDSASVRAAASVRPDATAIEEVYQKGEVDGTFKEFYPDGSLKREVRYIGGKVTGLFRTYYENGQIEQETVYLNGDIEGTYRSYYEDGKLHQEKEYLRGKLNGTYRAFDEFGIPFFEINYKESIQDGADKTFDQRGVLQYLDTYAHGVLVNRKTYDEIGNLKFDQDFEEEAAEAVKKEGEEKIKDRETREKEKRRHDKKEPAS